MKNLLQIAFFSLPFITSEAWADPCNEDRILKRMAVNRVIDLKDPSVCLDLSDFSNIKVKMQDTNYKLNENRAQGKPTPQDEAVKRIVSTLKSASKDGAKVITRGIADGTFNNAPNPNDAAAIQKENDFISKLTENGTLSAAKIKATIGKYDPVAADAIIKEIKKSFPSIPFSKIPDDSRLKSLIRNSLLAKSRGDFLCQQIFGNPSACETQGEVSPSLDSGKHNFEGCCDGRRGAVIEVITSSPEERNGNGNGKFQPEFSMPAGDFQGKMQTAASMSVFDLPLESDADLEAKVIGENGFESAHAASLLQRDRERFKKAMAGTGCAENEFAVDAARRIYWNVKSQKEFVSPALYDAVMKNDFATVLKLQKDKTTMNDNDLFSTLGSGANENVAQLRQKDLPGCADMRGFYTDKIKDFKDGENCAMVVPADSPLRTLLSNDGQPISSGLTLGHILKSKWIKQDTKKKYINEKDIWFMGDNDPAAKGNFYIYDISSRRKYFFSFDQKCADPTNVSLKKNEAWHTEQVSNRNEAFSRACIERMIKNNHGKSTTSRIPMSFFPKAPVSSGMPSDALNCLDASQAVEHELKNEARAEKLGTPMWKVKGEKGLDLVLNTTSGGRNVTPHSHKVGVTCSACGSGARLDPNTLYSARQDGEPALATKTYTDAHTKVADNPLTLSSLKHFRSYVIPNCGTTKEDACACLKEDNLEKRLKSKDVEVVDFSTIPDANKKSSLKIKENANGPYACIFTPPVPNTCSFNPYGTGKPERDLPQTETVTCPLDEALKTPIKNPASVTDADVKLYKQNCQSMNFPQSEASCVKDQNQGRMCFDIKGGVESSTPVKGTKAKQE